MCSTGHLIFYFYLRCPPILNYTINAHANRITGWTTNASPLTPFVNESFALFCIVYGFFMSHELFTVEAECFLFGRDKIHINYQYISRLFLQLLIIYSCTMSVSCSCYSFGNNIVEYSEGVYSCMLCCSFGKLGFTKILMLIVNYRTNINLLCWQYSTKCYNNIHPMHWFSSLWVNWGFIKSWTGNTAIQ